MKQRTPIKRTAPPKRVNAKRKRSEFARAYHSKERAAWVRSQPCAVCGALPSDNAHTGRNSGTGRKADADTIVPLCRSCHSLYHYYGPHFHHFDYAAAAADTERRWQEEAA